MYTLQFLAPFVAGLCFENFMLKQGELCNVRDYPPNVVKYDKPNPEHACYRDGIFLTLYRDWETDRKSVV